MTTQHVYMVRENATGTWMNNADELGYTTNIPAVFRDASDAVAFVNAWTEFGMDEVMVVAVPVSGWVTE
jgi:hypothetical protein